MSEIEYFYSAHSLFAYFGSARLTEIAQTAGRRIAHRPIDLPKALMGVGATPFKERNKKHFDYFFGREEERWAEYRNAPILSHRPTHHDNDTTLANCMLIAGLERGIDIGPLAHAILQAHWRDDADFASPQTLAALAGQVGIDAAPLLDAAGTPEIHALYDKNTAEAIARSVFGSPTYFVDGDMFYGQDRLEMVERALQKPFAGTWPRV
ncbi:MAG: 2-hydroxychromene-2-carboxylate isomerase [Proteobacteria bacterium]|nr:2-hydroxychromene-2-carboxylate isomerase [Pseudomonadota bacterium]MDA1356622.1 2-hydroxychromene-2-carboxylate isomerase [Pseudomonadota bacterium]